MRALVSMPRSPTKATWVSPNRSLSLVIWVLFQRRISGENRALTRHGVRQILGAALDHTGLAEPTTVAPLRFTPHDFRRLFITDAVLNGPPPHIAQVDDHAGPALTVGQC